MVTDNGYDDQYNDDDYDDEDSSGGIDSEIFY